MAKNVNKQFDISLIKKQIRENSVVVEPDVYVGARMPIYAANVNLRRTIPDINDGLLPVQRRVLMTMFEDGLYKGKLSKSVQIIGSCVKKYHPHGGSSVYNSMVLMGQNFRNNVTMVRKIGNFGSAFRPSGYAADRYTNAGISDFAYDCYFKDWKFSSPKSDYIIDWMPNFNDTGLEPMYFPAKYPVFLLLWRRQMGIGKYCSILGFNLAEAFNLVIKLIKNPRAKEVIYPDDPEGCDLINAGDFNNVLDSTTIKAKMRSTYTINHRNGKDVIEISNTPFEVDPTTVMDAIKAAVEKGKLPEVSDIGGNSENFGESFRLSIELKKGYDPDATMTKIYKETQLENTYIMRYSFVNGLQSVEYTLRIAILEWLRGRRETIRRIHKADLIRVVKRRHFLEPLIKVIESGEIDEFIHIVRTNDRDVAKKIIMRQWELTDYQADCIVGVRIIELSKDKLIEYKDELKELKKEQAYLTSIVDSDDRIDEIIIADLKEAIVKYGRPRKTDTYQLMPGDNIADTEHYLIFTNKTVKKLPFNDDRSYKIGKLDNDEVVKQVLIANNKDTILIFTNDARCTPVQVSSIPNSSTSNLGVSYVSLKAKSNNFIKAINLSDYNSETIDDYSIVSLTKLGLVSRTSLAETEGRVLSFALMRLDGDELVSVAISKKEDSSRVLIWTKNGMCSIYGIDDISETGIYVKGQLGIRIEDDDRPIGISYIDNRHPILFIATRNGYCKRIELNGLPSTRRGGRLFRLSDLLDDDSIVQAISEPIVANTDVESHVYLHAASGIYDLDPSNIGVTHRTEKSTRTVVLSDRDYIFDAVTYSN